MRRGRKGAAGILCLIPALVFLLGTPLGIVSADTEVAGQRAPAGAAQEKAEAGPAGAAQKKTEAGAAKAAQEKAEAGAAGAAQKKTEAGAAGAAQAMAGEEPAGAAKDTGEAGLKETVTETDEAGLTEAAQALTGEGPAEAAQDAAGAEPAEAAQAFAGEELAVPAQEIDEEGLNEAAQAKAGEGPAQAGIEPALGSVRGSGLLTELWGAQFGETVTIDQGDWFVIKKQTVDGVNCVLLLKKGGSYYSGAFGSTTTKAKYEGSLLQGRMTDYLTYYLPTIRAIAVKPVLGDHSSATAVTVPTAVMAGAETKDILFPLSFKDAYELNGDRYQPLIPLLKNHFIRFYLRTAATAENLYGVLPAADGLEAGLHYLSDKDIRDVPAVWVSTSVSYNVTVHYIDTDGVPIGSPVSATYPVPYDGDFALDPALIPNIPGYEYIQWKKGASGTTQDGSVPVTAQNVKADMDIYLIYGEAAETTLTVTKTVEGPYADKTREFGFTVWFYDDALGQTASLATGGTYDFYMGGNSSSIPDGFLTAGAGGELEFDLAHGQSITIDGVPPGGYIQVIEAPDFNYSVALVDSETPLVTEEGNDTADTSEHTGLREMSDGRAFHFINTRESVVETGVHIGGAGAMLLLPVLAGLAGAAYAAVLIARRRRIREGALG